MGVPYGYKTVSFHNGEYIWGIIPEKAEILKKCFFCISIRILTFSGLPIS